MGRIEGKILLTEEVHKVLVDGLKESGLKIDYLPDHSYDDLQDIIHEYVGVITRSRIKIDRALLEKAGSLKFIGRVGAGMESIDVDFARSKGITCLNSPEGSRDALGEHTVGMLLNLANNINRADSQVRKGIWNREANRGSEIKGKTVGIIGYGNMGGAFARKLSGFEARVIAYDKYRIDYSDAYVTEVDMQTIFRETDILSFHVPLTEETHYLFNRDYLERFSKPIILINTARGPVVNTADLVRGLESGKVTGAALDVIEYEKFSFDDLEMERLPDPLRYLVSSDRVVFTPHVAGWTVESQVKLSEVLLDKIKKEFDM
jgi:D-3-phosphoglycerate dehydrogenase